MKKLFVTVAALGLSVAAHAQDVPPAPAAAPVSYSALVAMKVPVTAGDVSDRPYRVVGEIEAGVRKATIFSKSASEAKVYRELWERGRKLGADAVIQASYGNSHITAMSWGSRKARGKAVKFLTDAEIGAVPVPASADTPNP